MSQLAARSYEKLKMADQTPDVIPAIYVLLGRQHHTGRIMVEDIRGSGRGPKLAANIKSRIADSGIAVAEAVSVAVVGVVAASVVLVVDNQQSDQSRHACVLVSLVLRR